MFRFTNLRKALAVSKYSKTVLGVLMVGLLASSLVAANGLQPAGAAIQPLICSGPSTGSVNQTLTFTASGGTGQYNWSSNQGVGTGSTYQVSFPNAGQKTITLISGTQATNCSVQISNGGGGTGPVSCTGPATLGIGVLGTFTAQGGNGSYSWSSNQGTGTGQTYQASFPNAGTKIITVTSGGQSGTCSVQVTGGGTVLPLACSGPTSGFRNQPVTFTASGSNGQYNWSSNQGVGTGSTYTVSFPNAGTKVITLTSAGQTDTCTIQIANGNPMTPLTVSCVANPLQGPPGTTVTWTATASGGSGGYTYSWTGNGSFPSGVTGNPVNHQYLGGTGQRNANVTVSDSSGQTATASCHMQIISGGGGTPGGCSNMQYGQITASGNTARVTVTNPNTSGNCPVETNLSVYKVYVAFNGNNRYEFLSTQRLFDTKPATLSAGETRTLTVSLPNCAYQVDLFRGLPPGTPPFTQDEAQGRVLTWLQSSSAQPVPPLCTDVVIPPTLSCSANIWTARIGQPVSFTAQGGDGSFGWTGGGNPASGSGQTFTTSYSSVGQKWATVTSAGRTATCKVMIIQDEIPQLTCSPSNQTVNVNQSATFIANGGTAPYSWTGGGSPSSGSGTSFNTSYGTSGTRTVTVHDGGGRTATCNVNVNPVVVNAPVCNPSSQSANLGQTVSFSATGGNGTFSWNASTGSPSSGSGSGFSASFNSVGSHVVTVTSNGLTSSCVVNVNPIITGEMSCSPNSQTVRVGNYASFSATGGSGSYFWNASNANPSSGNGQNFTAQFFNQGTWSVSVHDGAGRTATCNVTVIQDYNPQYPSCSPSYQTANVNQQVSFYGNGGTGNFSWNAPNGQPVYGYGSVFTTSFGAPGQYNVTLNSNGQTATCTVNIQNNFVNGAPFCSPSTQNANVGDFVNFSATGGNGSYFWTAAQDGLPSSGNGSLFGTRFSTPGTKFVTVNSNGQTSQCIVQIGDVLGASTVVTGPEDVAAAALGLGFLGALAAYGAVEKEKAKKLLAKFFSR